MTIKNILCNDFDQLVFSQVSCSIKVRRGQRGLLTFKVVLAKPISDVWVRYSYFCVK